jgi:hypothetical protein
LIVETVGDLLSASSVLLALYGFVFGVWYPEIDRGLGVKVPRTHLEDAEQEREFVGTAARRVLPLTIGAIVGAAVFLPKAISLIRKLVRETHRGWPWFPQYSAIDTSYVLVSIAFAGFALWTGVLLIKLWQKRAELTPPPRTS